MQTFPHWYTIYTLPLMVGKYVCMYICMHVVHTHISKCECDFTRYLKPSIISAFIYFVGETSYKKNNFFYEFFL